MHARSLARTLESVDDELEEVKSTKDTQQTKNEEMFNILFDENEVNKEKL